MSVLKEPILVLSRSDRVKQLLTSTPVAASLITGYVPGETTESAVAAAGALAADGLLSTLDFLGEDTTDRGRAESTAHAYTEVLEALAAAGLTRSVELSVKPTAIGLALPTRGFDTALTHARTICQAARNAGTTVTIDMEDHTTTESTLHLVRELRKDFPETGAVIQAYLPRSESDCRALAHEGSRVRLCKGAYAEPGDIAYTDRLEVDRAYVRCLKALMAGEGYPMVATHDPRMIRIASTLAGRFGRQPGTYEYQMLYGIRPAEQRRLAEAGERVRVYVPYGTEWYGYLMRRLAERPANLALFLKSLVSKQ